MPFTQSKCLAGYEMGRSFGLAITSIPKFYIQHLLTHFAVPKRFNNPLINGLSSLFYTVAGVSLLLSNDLIGVIEEYVFPPLFGRIGERLGNIIETHLPIRLNNYAHAISLFSEDLLPRTFTASWSTAALSIATGFSFVNGLLLGASLYSAYRIGSGLINYVKIRRQSNTLSSELKSIADNLKQQEAKFQATSRFFNVVKRLISPQKPIYVGQHSIGEMIFKAIEDHFGNIQKDFFIKKDYSSLTYELKDKNDIHEFFASSFFETVKHIKSKINPADFAVASSIRWVHGSTSAALVGMKKNALLPFGTLIEEFAPYAGELRAGIGETGVSHRGISGVSALQTEKAWIQYAKSFDTSARHSIVQLAGDLSERMGYVFNAKGEIRADTRYAELLSFILLVKRLQQWDPQGFDTWLSAKDQDDYLSWFLNKFRNTPVEISVINLTCLMNLKSYLQNNIETQPDSKKAKYSQLQKLLDDILSKKSVNLSFSDKCMVISEFPILFASTRKDAPQKFEGSMNEVVWQTQEGLKLGKEIDVIITDTHFHQQQVENFLYQKGVSGVKCITYTAFNHAQAAIPSLLDSYFIDEANYVVGQEDLEKALPYAYNKALVTQLRSQPEKKQAALAHAEFLESNTQAMKKAFCFK